MIEVKDIKEKKIDENYKFRRYLKSHADEETLDKQFKKLHDKYFKNFDCAKCRNCCKELGISMTEHELKKICKEYNYDIDKLKNEVLTENHGEYVASPCPFLKEGKCELDKCKPQSCTDYPYTDKPERLFSLFTIVNNSKICPVVYQILEDLKKEYNFK